MDNRRTHVYLTGYRGTGKSTVARLLAARLNLEFVDTDRLIETRSGCSIREIFAKQGESGFRDLEELAVRSASQSPAAVIALGGGAILRESTRNLIRDTGFCVWLTAPPEILLERIETDANSRANRPALTQQRSGLEEIRDVLSSRQSLYKGVADCEVETQNRSPEEVVELILSRLSRRDLGSEPPSP